MRVLSSYILPISSNARSYLLSSFVCSPWLRLPLPLIYICNTRYCHLLQLPLKVEPVLLDLVDAGRQLLDLHLVGMPVQALLAHALVLQSAAGQQCIQSLDLGGLEEQGHFGVGAQVDGGVVGQAGDHGPG